jgi:hypothetical protein
MLGKGNGKEARGEEASLQRLCLSHETFDGKWNSGQDSRGDFGSLNHKIVNIPKFWDKDKPCHVSHGVERSDRATSSRMWECQWRRSLTLSPDAELRGYV